MGDYIADIMVEDSIIVELKAVKTLDNIHLAQTLNSGVFISVHRWLNRAGCRYTLTTISTFEV